MSNKNYLDNNNFFKPTYYQAIEYIVPKYTLEDDLQTFGQEIDPTDLVVSSHLTLANNISSVLLVNPIVNSPYSSLNTLAGIAPYFIKQNNLTVITPSLFELNILNRMGTTFKSFETSSDFRGYVSATLLPAITVNNVGSSFYQSDPVSTAGILLINNLSWLYFLNNSGTSYDPSTFVMDEISSKLYSGKTIYLNDCLKGLTEHLWYNNLSSYIPPQFLSGTDETTSGIQQLEKLKTWIDIVYSNLYADRADFTVRDRFEIFIDNQTKITNKISAGPMQKLLRLMSFLFFDINNDTERIESLYDIDDCPNEYLPLLAELIGWKLFGSNQERWRLQLKNAVEVYKKVGTKKSIQFALNSIFPKDIFSIESRLTELWESYIPYLIYYALATDSRFFTNNSTWTRSNAQELNVVGYSTSSIDENIKLATDRIIYETYLSFSSAFRFPNKDNKFFYRGRSYPIPPFEEYPYYVNVEVSPKMIDFIADRLACFGVTREFALQVRDFIYENTLEVDEEIRSSSWLFFTADYKTPPNLDKLILNLYNRKFEYAPLWSGKSSHFKLVFDATEFDFTKENSDDIDSINALNVASEIVNEFAPAHAIPLVTLTLSSIDYETYRYDEFPIVSLQQQDIGPTFGKQANYQASATRFGTYKRGTGGKAAGRRDYISLQSPLILGASSLGTLERNTKRRRSYEKLMPFYGYYDRTGFNMPTTWNMDSSLSGFPLGFIPSSLSFQTVSDVFNLPDVYKNCDKLNSSASYFGYAVSTVFPCRGDSGLVLRDYYCDRGQLPEIYALMHSLKEKAKEYIAEYSIDVSASENLLSWNNVYVGLANSATEVSGWFPANYNDFYNFQFGRQLHKLYNYYKKEFKRHRLNPIVQNQDGCNIFSHTFGPIFDNHDFYSTDSNYTTTSLSSPIILNAGNPGFSNFISSSVSSMAIDGREYVNSSILSSLHMIIPSGSSSRNFFSVIKLDPSVKPSWASDYMYNNTFIKMHTRDTRARLRMGISNNGLFSSTIDSASSNFLLPDSLYDLNIKALITNEDASILGGINVGVWIHTKPEGSYMWSYTNDGWVEHSSTITKAEVFANYLFRFNNTQYSNGGLSLSSNSIDFKCLDDIVGGVSSLNSIGLLKESDFQTFNIKFDTCNSKILVSNGYKAQAGSCHKLTQDYFVEMFILNTNSGDRYLLLDKLELVNSNLNLYSKYLPFDSCPEYRIPLEKYDIQTLFRFWNDIVGKNYRTGFASRNKDTVESATVSVNPNGAGGGSRLDYRYELGWDTIVYYNGSVIEQIVVKL